MAVELDVARSWAAQLLEPLGDRWTHVRAVAARASDLCDVLGQRRNPLVAAAWLHDVGYAPEIARLGFHPLDGARFVRSIGADQEVASLVAHHSWAVIEAEMRGLKDELLAEFPPPDPDLADALCYCDMTTGPTGEYVTVEERIAEIKVRYGEGHLVTRFITEATPLIVGTVRRVEARLAEAQSR